MQRKYYIELRIRFFTEKTREILDRQLPDTDIFCSHETMTYLSRINFFVCTQSYIIVCMLLKSLIVASTANREF